MIKSTTIAAETFETLAAEGTRRGINLTVEHGFIRISRKATDRVTLALSASAFASVLATEIGNDAMFMVGPVELTWTTAAAQTSIRVA